MSEGVKLGLKLALVTAQRKGEIVGAAWSEIDFEQKVWTIPAERSKNGRSHRVPLTASASAILNALRDNLSTSEWVFPSPTKSGRHINNV